ncbi:cysteine synthase, chloroplastic/chromoplastic-like isoform X2 [Triticum dicoccoides]|uniref:cysteine synthase, chloroplastic/chromoplastic-like isoform X2 n=1 Tax=Triticum dicoccoides TaxID=85692 RepID=UPI001890FBDF|nr:cysteine synthase, chloroplastic/chromoplastic-like isoform X2 [Triticum dicoccoides]
MAPGVGEAEGAGRRGVPSLLAGGGTGQEEHIASDVTQLIGWTPLIELKRVAGKEGVGARIVGKMEAYQPLCSVKDRSALRMIEDAEEKGLISPGVTTLVEPTSGNLGLGLVLIALSKGYRFVAVMPGQYSLDKQILLRYMGAELFITAMVNARRLAMEEGLLVGISSGANLAACLKVAAREENKGKMIVTMFPSGGERYMNSDLFAAVREECIAMTF